MPILIYTEIIPEAKEEAISYTEGDGKRQRIYRTVRVSGIYQ
jgi:hypothetical protein